jgi:NAD(P)-dependent dehydrogenase (short-subunit alcohol dehydrogenase family)
MTEMFDLSGKIAIVTGGNRGIGYGIARGLAQAGATIVVANRNVAGGQKAVETLKKEGGKAVHIALDISKVSSIVAMVSEVVRQFGKIDILVNNAAVIIRKPAEEYTEEDWDTMVNTNLRGTFFCAELVAREMIKRKQGKIINISSVLSQMGQVGRAIYATTKAGVSHMTRTLGVEWIKYGINVNAIGPGVTITEINRDFFKTHPDDFQRIMNGVPANRPASPDDYIGAAVFLASDAANYMVGQTLIIDGGMTIV